MKIKEALEAEEKRRHGGRLLLVLSAPLKPVRTTEEHMLVSDGVNDAFEVQS